MRASFFQQHIMLSSCRCRASVNLRKEKKYICFRLGWAIRLHPLARIDIFIVGIGIRGVSEITPETERILRRSTQIFYMDPRTLVSRYFKKINSNSYNLFKHYEEGRKAYDVYEEFSSLV